MKLVEAFLQVGGDNGQQYVTVETDIGTARAGLQRHRSALIKLRDLAAPKLAYPAHHIKPHEVIVLGLDELEPEPAPPPDPVVFYQQPQLNLPGPIETYLRSRG